MKVGDRAKIYDIGPLAEVLRIGHDEVYLRLDGGAFWRPVSIIDRMEVD